MAMATKKVLREAYDFWFGEIDGPETFPADRSERWFKSTPEFDTEIRERFAPFFRSAAEIIWDLATLNRKEQIGLVILLDQFPRNSFRDSPEAFAHDEAARSVAKRLIQAGAAHFPIERLFLYLPLEHSEEFVDQEQSVRLFRGLLSVAPAANRAYYVLALDQAIKHYGLIARFDRFPHRNAALGRTPSDAEAAFLKENGRGF